MLDRRQAAALVEDGRSDLLLGLVADAQVNAAPLTQHQHCGDGEQGHRQQVDAHRGGAARRLDQRGRDHRRERAAQDRAQGVGDGDAGKADGGREEFGVPGRLRTVGQPQAHREDRQPQEQRLDPAGVDQGEQRKHRQHLAGVADQVRLAAADPVRQHAAKQREHQPESGGAGDGEQHRRAPEADRSVGIGGVVGDESARGHVAGGVVAGEDQRGKDHQQPVPAEQFDDRHAGLLVALGNLGEHGRLVDGAAHVVADQDHHHAQQEGNAPAPLDEGLARGDPAGHERHDAGGQQHPQRHADLRERAGQPAPRGRRVFHRHQHGAAPFAAGGDALQDAQQQQQRRRQDAGRGVAWQHADQRGGATHQQQRENQNGAPAQPVAEMSGQEGAERAEEEADTDGGEGHEQPDSRACRLEEQVGEDQPCRRCIDEEVIPFDGRADDGGDGHAPLDGRSRMGARCRVMGHSSSQSAAFALSPIFFISA